MSLSCLDSQEPVTTRRLSLTENWTIIIKSASRQRAGCRNGAPDQTGGKEGALTEGFAEVDHGVVVLEHVDLVDVREGLDACRVSGGILPNFLMAVLSFLSSSTLPEVTTLRVLRWVPKRCEWGGERLTLSSELSAIGVTSGELGARVHDLSIFFLIHLRKFR